MSLGDNIKKYRKMRGLTQVELAERANMSRSYLADIERNRYNPSVETLQTVASALGTDFNSLLGQSISAIIRDRLEQKGMSLEVLAEQAKVPIGYLKNLDAVQPIEHDYEVATRIAKVLSVAPKELHTALTLQEPPIYEGPRRSAADDFGHIPSWATKKDVRDFKQMLEEDGEVMFDGVPIEGEARQRVMDVLTGLFWEAKNMNKTTYGRKNNKDANSKDNEE